MPGFERLRRIASRRFRGQSAAVRANQLRGVWRFARDWGRVELGDEAGNKPVETFQSV